jgi:lytic murein transglycosylase
MISGALLFAIAISVPPEFRECVRQLRVEAKDAGIRGNTFDRAMKGVEPDQSVIDAMNTQPEIETPIWDYMDRLVSPQRIVDGQARIAQWSAVLDRAEQAYGVDRYTLVAVWGVESDYGRIMGQRPLMRSLATVSCYGDRQKFFRGELFAALNIVQAGDIKLDTLKGSWAGAFGHTQFIPTTFQRLAVDFDGDGKRDLINSVPDALGSVGNFLKASGWRRDQPWGYEVRIPENYHGPSGRHQRQPLAEWVKLGVTRADGTGLVGDGEAALLLPTGTRGPAFIIFPNFDAIHAYNRSESYALAIAHLADRFKGGAPIQAKWPTDDPILTRTERRELQERLIKRGLLEGDADGIVGSRTIAAIKSFQASAGLPSDGYASARVLNALREGPPAPPGTAPAPAVSSATP